ELMEGSVEDRLGSLEQRLARIERALALETEAGLRPPVAREPAPTRPPAAARPPVAARPPLDLEALLGGRVLAWLGGSAGAVGVAGAAIAVRWSSQVVGGIGILGALLAPVLVDAGTSSASLVFMAIALLAAVAVLVWQRWPWLAFGSFVVSVPQLLGWID